MKEGWFGSQKGTWRRRTAWMSIGWLAIALLLNGGLREAPNQPNLGSVRAPAAASVATLVEQQGVPWYFHSGQWRADVRSLIAALRYLTQSDSMVQTNPMPTRAHRV